VSDVELTNPPVSGSLEAFGVASAAAVAARGNSLVLAAPPAPAYTLPVLAALLGRPAESAEAGPVLVIAPDASLEAWGQAVALAGRQAGVTVAVAPNPSRAAHHLASSRVAALVLSLATTTELLRRSQLRTDGIRGVVIIWPELELSDEGFVPIFADLPKETQRVVVTTDPAGTATFAERYAWRAPTMGPLANPTQPAQLGRVRGAAVRWDDRLAAVARAADLLNLDEVEVWTASADSHGALTERLAGHGVTARPVAGAIPAGPATIFFDAPPPELLAQAALDTSVVLVAPGAERYFGRIAGRIDPLTLPGGLDQAERAIQEDRRAIRSRLEGPIDRGAYATVAPLLDRWSGAEVAVAVQSLWTEARTRAPAPAATSAPLTSPHPKVWINLGRKDGATPAELLSVVLGAGVKRDTLGRLELRDGFSLVEMTSEFDAINAAEKLAGHEYKGRRLAARLDRSRESDSRDRDSRDRESRDRAPRDRKPRDGSRPPRRPA